ncbi:hypothetical protein V1503_15715 [Bacillus sp. SCS-151]|uniref:hypothetical protein n=1 Tax=Nanhaiella sioensis TaxID=3115293 RepID=UPI003978C23A
MEQIIDFFISNIVLLVILFGVFSRIFKGFSSGASNSRRTSTTNEEKPVIFNEVEDMHIPQTSTVEHENEVVESKVDLYHQLKEVVRERNNQSIEKTEPMQKKSSKQVQKENKLSITKKSVVQGVIFSEILGAPRGKKPYQPISHRSQSKMGQSR